MAQTPTTKDYLTEKPLNRLDGITGSRETSEEASDAIVKVASDGGTGPRLE